MMHLLIFPVLIPMVGAIVSLFFRMNDRYAGISAVAGAVVHLVSTGLLLTAVVKQGVMVLWIGGWTFPAGICLVADLLSAVLVVTTAVIHTAVMIYACKDLHTRQVRAGFHSFMQMLTAAVCGAFLTGDLFNLYVWFEVMLMASFGILVMGHPAGRLTSAVKYVTLNLVSTLMLLTGIGLIYGLTGTLNLADLHEKVLAVENTAALTSTAMLLMTAFGIKAALFPLFFWLPAAYPTLPPGVAAFFGGLLTKVGVYALIRLFTLVFVSQPQITHTTLMVAALLTMVSGVVTAASQTDIRRILSFHIISQVGYMVLGLAVYTPLALAAALVYLVHNIIAKANLFLVGGLIHRVTGSFDLSQIGSLYKTHGLLAVLFFIPAFALAGVPPLSGFWAKLLIIYACLESRHYLPAALAAGVGLLTLFSMVKIWMEAFWKPGPRNTHFPDEPGKNDPVTPACGTNRAGLDESAPRNQSLSLCMAAPVICLCLVTVLMGIFIEPLLVLSVAAGEQLMDPAAYVLAVKGGK